MDPGLRPIGPPVAVVAHPGTQSSLHVAAALARYGLLRWHLTGVYPGVGWFGRLAGRWIHRRHPALGPEQVRVRSREELLATLVARVSGQPDVARAVHLWRNRRFGRWAGQIAGRHARVLHGFETAALEAFRIARSHGVAGVLHVVSPPPRFTQALHAEERLRYPLLADTLPRVERHPAYGRRREQEMALADRIVVASRFMADLLTQEGVPLERIRVIPRPVDLEAFARLDAEADRLADPIFRAVYVGNLTQHKGLGYLLDAWRRLRLPHAQLLLIGEVIGRGRWRRSASGGPDGVHLVGRVRRADLVRWLACCHVSVFPTLGDGFGVVVPEAMAAGLPVIATPRCCAPELIRDGQEGFLVPCRDVPALADRLAYLYRNRERAIAMGRAARAAVSRLAPEDSYQALARLTCELADLPWPAPNRETQAA